MSGATYGDHKLILHQNPTFPFLGRERHIKLLCGFGNPLVNQSIKYSLGYSFRTD
jgi:hypothetical protein